MSAFKITKITTPDRENSQSISFSLDSDLIPYGMQHNFEIMENLSFTPFRTIEENSPIGNLQRSRQSAYVTSSTSRHELNHKKRKEPKNLEEAFSPEFYQL